MKLTPIEGDPFKGSPVPTPGPALKEVDGDPFRGPVEIEAPKVDLKTKSATNSTWAAVKQEIEDTAKAFNINFEAAFPETVAGQMWYYKPSGVGDITGAEELRNQAKRIREQIGRGKRTGKSTVFWNGRLVPFEEVQKQVDKLEGRADELEKVGMEKRRTFIKKWREFQKAFDEHKSKGVLPNIAAWAGYLAGSATTPESLIPVGRAATLAGTFAKGAAVNAAANILTEPLVQASQIKQGVRQDFDVTRMALSGVLGGVAGGTLNVTPALIGKLARAVRGKKPIGKPLTQNDVIAAIKNDPEAQKVLKDMGIPEEQWGKIADIDLSGEKPRIKVKTDPPNDAASWRAEGRRLAREVYDLEQQRRRLFSEDSERLTDAQELGLDLDKVPNNDKKIDELTEQIRRLKIQTKEAFDRASAATQTPPQPEPHIVPKSEVPETTPNEIREGTARLSPEAKKDPSAVTEWGRHATDDQTTLEVTENVARELVAPRWYDRTPVVRGIAQGQRIVLQTTMGRLQGIARRWQSPSAQTLADMFGYTPGEARAVGPHYVQAVNQRIGEQQNILAQMMRNARKTMTSDEIMEAVDIASGIRAPKPGTKAARLAARLEDMITEHRRYLGEAGIDVNVESYYPRLLDKGLVLKDPSGFQRAAYKAFLDTFNQQAKWAQKRARGENLPDKPGVQKDADAGDAFLKDGKIDRQSLERAATEAAEAWRINETQGRLRGATAFGTFPRTPAQNFLKSRTLAARVERYLKDYYIRDPEDALNRYITQTARRAEWTRRMGPDNEQFRQLEAQMREEGLPPEVRDEIIGLISSIAGLGSGSHGAMAFTGFVRLWTTLGVLEKATMSSASELAMPAIRSGKTGALFTKSMQSIKEMGMDILREDIPITQRKSAAREFAENLGIVSHGLAQQMLEAKFGGLEPVTQKQHRIMTKYFRGIGLHQFTEGTLTAASDLAHTVLRSAALRIKKGDAFWYKTTRALDDLKELGVPEEKAKAFADYVLKHDSTAESLRTDPEMFEVYRAAVYRFAEQTIMMPSTTTRPAWANNHWGAVAFHLMSFIYAFHKNVLNRSFVHLPKRAVKKGYGVGDRAAMLAPAALALSVLPTIQYGMLWVRHAVYGGQNPNEMTEVQRVNAALSRAGLFGMLDPMVNIVSSARYNKSVAESLYGPSGGRFIKFADTIIQALTNNSEKTNSRERAMAKNIYDLFVEPVLNLGGVVAGRGLNMVAPQATGSQRDNFVDWMAGPKKQRTSKSGLN